VGQIFSPSWNTLPIVAGVAGSLGPTASSVPTAAFQQDKILKHPDEQIFDVITNGTGLMSGYRRPIPPADNGRSSACVRELERRRLTSAAGIK
jgi:hypothetical protein